MTVAFVACSSPQVKPVTEEISKPQGARVEESAQVVWEKIKKHPNYFEVRNREGILEFSTPQVFEEYRNKMTNQPQAILDKWEKTLNFESMRSILEKAKEEEHKHFEAKMKKNLKEPDLSRSAYFERYGNLFDWDKGHITLKMPLLSMATLLNEEGLVRVAGHLFQYSENTIKIIIGGDKKKLGLLKNLDKTDNAQGITVLPITTSKKLLQNGRVEGQSYDFAQMAIPASFPTVEAFFSSTLYLSTYSQPIFDYQNPIYVCVGYYPEFQFCYWEYPIIGYNPTTASVTAYMSAVCRSFIGGYSDLPIENRQFYSSVGPPILGQASAQLYIGPLSGANVSCTSSMSLFYNYYSLPTLQVYP